MQPSSGIASLSVSFDATQHADIVSYNWNFGDGNGAQGPSQVHVYDTPGTYTTELTVTDTNGDTYATQRNVYVFADLDNGSAIVPNTVLFHDGFNYAASRNDPNAGNAFTSAGWGGFKSEASTPGAKGYIYTTDTIPGYSGPFPGANSSRVLVIEALPSSLGDRSTGFWGDMQTDFYLQYGDVNSPTDTVPSNVWFQFWIYPTGNFDHYMKLIYPCRGDYPCQDLKWLMYFGTVSAEPHWIFNGLADIDGPASDTFLRINAPGASYSVPSYWGGSPDYGHQDLSEMLVANRWTKVKFHVDTSGPQGRYEAWLKPLGGPEVKVAEWYGDVTPNFTWPNSPGGHRQFRMPTTIGTWRMLSEEFNFDSITYMDDFSMATSEDDLPVYPY